MFDVYGTVQLAKYLTRNSHAKHVCSSVSCSWIKYFFAILKHKVSPLYEQMSLLPICIESMPGKLDISEIKMSKLTTRLIRISLS